MGHYYTLTGDSCHEVTGKNGKVRPTNVRDARELNLVPSVTTIMDAKAKPALVVWLQNQLLEAAMASPFNMHSDHPAYWKKKMIQESRKVGEKAAKRGNEIHDAMEKFFVNMEYDDVEQESIPYVEEAIQLLLYTFPDYMWYPENSFAHVDGFGGRVDLWGADINNNCVIIDFKTKDKTDVRDMVQYDDHCTQLAAYQRGLQLPDNTRRFNLFISVNPETPGLCKLVECTKFDKYIDIFYSLLKLWQLTNNHIPRGAEI